MAGASFMAPLPFLIFHVLAPAGDFLFFNSKSLLRLRFLPPLNF
jgi:hypothetical protein